MRRLTAEEVRDAILAVSGDAAAQGRRAEHLPADPPRGPGRPVGARARAGTSRRPTRPPGGASTSTSSGRCWSRSWRPTTRPTPTPVAPCATRRPCRPRRSACSTASSPTSRRPASPTGCAARPPATWPRQVRRAIRLDHRPRARPPTRSAATSTSSGRSRDRAGLDDAGRADAVLPAGAQRQCVPLPRLRLRIVNPM